MDKRDRPLVPVLATGALYFFGSGYLALRLGIRLGDCCLRAPEELSQAEHLGLVVLKWICMLTIWGIMLLIGWFAGKVLIDRYLPPPPKN